MNTTSSRVGMTTPLILTIVLVIAALAGAAVYSVRNRAEVSPMPMDATMEEDEGAMETGEEMMEENDAMMKGDDAMMEESGATAPFDPQGTVIVGSVSPFIDYNTADYDKALSEGRTVLLYFYANWCPICRVEIQDTEAAFRELTDPRIVGFRVNYNDDETDGDEESLARQYGIAYQHTKVILHNGAPSLKDGSTWSRDRYLQELRDAVQ